jgi:hypothetical protein
MAPPLTPDNLIPDGGYLLPKTSYSSTALIPSKILDNSKLRREITTLYCVSTQAGTWHLYDVDENGTQAELPNSPVAVAANVIAVFNPPGVTERVWTTFTPTAATPGNVTIRGFVSGFGVRG